MWSYFNFYDLFYKFLDIHNHQLITPDRGEQNYNMKTMVNLVIFYKFGELSIHNQKADLVVDLEPKKSIIDSRLKRFIILNPYLKDFTILNLRPER